MSNELKVTKTQLNPNCWTIENLTDEELNAVREALGTASLPTARNLQDLKSLLDDTPIF